MSLESDRLTKLETSDSFMARQIDDIKKDIKEIKQDVGELKMSFARWSTGIVVAVSVIQYLITLLK